MGCWCACSQEHTNRQTSRFCRSEVRLTLHPAHTLLSFPCDSFTTPLFYFSLHPLFIIFNMDSVFTRCHSIHFVFSRVAPNYILHCMLQYPRSPELGCANIGSFSPLPSIFAFLVYPFLRLSNIRDQLPTWFVWLRCQRTFARRQCCRRRRGSW